MRIIAKLCTQRTAVRAVECEQWNAFYLCFFHFKLRSLLHLWEFRNGPGLLSAFAAFIGRVCQQSGGQSASFWPPCPSPLLVPPSMAHLSVFLCLHLWRASMRVKRFYTFVCHVCTFAFTLSTRA
jgi:hypothetical protein